MNDGGDDGACCAGIKVRTDTTKLSKIKPRLRAEWVVLSCVSCQVAFWVQWVRIQSWRSWDLQDCQWHMLQKPAPENASVSGAFVIQSGAEFFGTRFWSSQIQQCSISQQNLATTWSKYWFVIGQWSMLLLFSFVNWSLLFYTGRFILGQQPCADLAIQENKKKKFSFVGVVNCVCILDYWNYITIRSI